MVATTLRLTGRLGQAFAFYQNRGLISDEGLMLQMINAFRLTIQVVKIIYGY